MSALLIRFPSPVERKTCAVSGHERGKPSKPDAYLLKHRELYDDLMGEMLCRALELMDLGDVKEGV